MNTGRRTRSTAPVTAFELTVVVFAAAAVLLLASWPYIEGFRHGGSGMEFTSVLSGHEDYNTYFVKMEAGRRGQILYRNPYRATSAAPLPLHLFWIGLGWIAAAVRAPVETVYHAARVGMGALLLGCAYGLLRTCLGGTRSSLLAFLLLTVSSGASGLLAHLRYFRGHRFPWFADVIVPESNTFFSLLVNPAFLFCVAMMAIAATGLLRAVEGRSNGWAAGIAALLLGLVHPMSMGALWVVLGAFILVEALAGTLSARKASALALRVFGTSAPAAVYHFLLWRLSPEVRSWVAQNLCPSPSPLSYLAGYGVLWLPAVVGLAACLGARRPAARLVSLWLLLGFALLYAPVSVQRRLGEGYHLGVVLAASFGMARLRRAWLWPALVVLSMPTTHLVFRSFMDRARLGSYPSFVEKDVVTGMRWLAETRPGAVVLCAPESAWVVTRYGRGRVVAGHWAETPDYDARVGEVRAILGGAVPSAEAGRWLDQWGVEVFLWTPRETVFAGGAPPALLGWSVAWRRGAVTIWERDGGKGAEGREG